MITNPRLATRRHSAPGRWVSRELSLLVLSNERRRPRRHVTSPHRPRTTDINLAGEPPGTATPGADDANEAASPGGTSGVEMNALIKDSTEETQSETKEKDPPPEPGKHSDEGVNDEETVDGEQKEITFKLGRERTAFSVGEIPEGATKVDCSMCTKLTTLPEYFPATVTKVNLMHCESLTELPKHCPDSMTDIVLTGCKGVHGTFRLNKHLIIFKLEESRTEFSLDELPEGVTVVECSMCYELTALPDGWPDSVTKIYLNYCGSLAALPGIPPAALKSINTEYCGALPASVRSLGQFEVKSPADWHRVAAACLAAHLQRSTTDLPVIERFVESFLIGMLVTPNVGITDAEFWARVEYVKSTSNTLVGGGRRGGGGGGGDGGEGSTRKLAPGTPGVGPSDERQPALGFNPLPPGSGEHKGDGEERPADKSLGTVIVEEGGEVTTEGRIVICSKFKDFVGGSFVSPAWPPKKDTEEVKRAKARMLAVPNDLQHYEARRLLELVYRKKRKKVTVEDEKMILDKNQINLPYSAPRFNASSGNARLHRLTHIAHLVNPAHDVLGALLALPAWAQARLFQSEVSRTLLDYVRVLVYVRVHVLVQSYVSVYVRKVFFFVIPCVPNKCPFFHPLSITSLPSRFPPPSS